MPMSSPIGIGGYFKYECVDSDKNVKWKEVAKNGATTEGLNYVLNTAFHGTTQKSPWFCGLIVNSSALSIDDTLSSHSGWEEGTSYSGNRKEWTEGAASSRTMTNSTTMDFTITDSMIVKGSFLCASSAGTSDILFCTAVFTGGEQAVSSGDVLKVTYTLTASPL